MKEKKDRTERIICNLFSPIEIAYSNIFGPWEYPEEQDIVKKGSVEYVPFEGEYGMVFVTESGEKVHPYCGCLLNQSKSNIHFQS